jgi:hypothetical protein
MLRDQIEPLFKDLSIGNELELSLSDYMESSGRDVPLSYRAYRELVRHLARAAKRVGSKLRSENTFDFIIEVDKVEYRLVINDIDRINSVLITVGGFPNYKAAAVLLKRYSEQRAEDQGVFTFMQKVRHEAQNLTDMSGRLRKGSEQDLTARDALELSRRIGPEDSRGIVFRYKQRRSLDIEDSDGVRCSIDLTATKQDRVINRVESAPESYELEIELFRHAKGSNRPKLLDTFIKTADELYRVIYETDRIITKPVRDEVLATYRKQSGNDKPSLEVRNAISMEIYHATDKVANRYAVFDKAEGDRALMFIHVGRAYLISTNLHITDTGLDVDEKWNNTLIDGEYMVHERLFLPFDILFLEGKDVRPVQELRQRIAMLDSVVGDLLPKGCIYGKRSAEYTGEMRLDRLIAHFNEYAEDFYKTMTYNMKNRPKGVVLVQRKIALMPYGVSDAEVFCYMNVIWTLYRAGKLPYILDGLILTPLMQAYVTRRTDAALQELKWKPEDKNSIDFYMRFVRHAEIDHDTRNNDQRKPGEIMTLYNNVQPGALKGKPFRIAYLYVGEMDRGREVPVPFMRQQKLHIAHLYLDEKEGEAGVIRDLEGNAVRDGTVVECYYNNNSSVDERQRWVIMRTRWDKTESVMRYGRRYGNARHTAERVWGSIQAPFRYDDIVQLSNPKSYERHMESLRKRITPEMARLLQTENAYYQKVKKIMKHQNDFHNWVWSIVLYPYCNPEYNLPRRMVVWDPAFGRGGDIMKFYFARSDMVVGSDLDAAGLFTLGDSAMARYRQLSRVHENFPRMHFVHADATIPLTAEAQKAALVNTTRENLEQIERFFEGSERRPRQIFDAINIKFAFHYFLKDQTSWSNFCNNVNTALRPGGWMFVVCFDAELVMQAMGKEGRHTLEYVDEGGNRQKLHEIVQKFTMDKQEQQRVAKSGFGLGYAIDMFNISFMSEGKNHYTEYLVDQRFVKRELREHCNMELVETGTLGMLHKTNREFFDRVAPWEVNDKTRDFLLGVRKFYNQDSEINRLSYEITRLNRYYIFQKQGTIEELQEVARGKLVERKVPLKKTREVPKSEGRGKGKVQVGGESSSADSDSDSDAAPAQTGKSRSRGSAPSSRKKKKRAPVVAPRSESDDSDDDTAKTERAARGLVKVGKARKRVHVDPAAERFEEQVEGDSKIEEPKIEVSDLSEFDEDDTSGSDDGTRQSEDPDLN